MTAAISCPLCKHRQSGGNHCEACGRPLPAPSAAPAEEGASSACGWCGHRQSEGRYCDACGRARTATAPAAPSPAVEDTDLLTCAECGFPTEPPRCRNCGSRVASPEDV